MDAGFNHYTPSYIVHSYASPAHNVNTSESLFSQWTPRWTYLSGDSFYSLISCYWLLRIPGLVCTELLWVSPQEVAAVFRPLAGEATVKWAVQTFSQQSHFINYKKQSAISMIAKCNISQCFSYRDTIIFVFPFKQINPP